MIKRTTEYDKFEYIDDEMHLMNNILEISYAETWNGQEISFGMTDI